MISGGYNPRIIHRRMKTNSSADPRYHLPRLLILKERMSYTKLRPMKIPGSYSHLIIPFSDSRPNQEPAKENVERQVKS